MGLHDDLKESALVRREVANKLVRAAEKRRTPADRSYTRRVDALIEKASQSAHAAVGPMPPNRDPLRVVAWEQAWSREYHASMDSLCLAKGIRRQSHQADLVLLRGDG